jgi:hypothetical protein
VELLFREGAGHKVPVHTLHVTAGGGDVTHHTTAAPQPLQELCCLVRPQLHQPPRPPHLPYHISRGTAGGNCVEVCSSGGRCHDDGGRDIRPGDEPGRVQL